MSSFNSDRSSPYTEPSTVQTPADERLPDLTQRETTGIPIVLNDGGVPRSDEIVAASQLSDIRGNFVFRNPATEGRADYYNFDEEALRRMGMPITRISTVEVLPSSPYEIGKTYCFHLVDCRLNENGRFGVEAEVLQVFDADLKIRTTHLHDTEERDPNQRRKPMSYYSAKEAVIILPMGSIILAECQPHIEDKKGSRIDNVIKNTNNR